MQDAEIGDGLTAQSAVASLANKQMSASTPLLRHNSRLPKVIISADQI
jgi:hypothetical protein